MLDVRLGSTTTVAGTRWIVVGTVENPAALADEFALVGDLPRSPDEVTLLVDGTQADVDGFRAPSGGVIRTASAAGAAAAVGGVVALGAILLALVSLVAAAAFAVVARRRQPPRGD